MVGTDRTTRIDTIGDVMTEWVVTIGPTDSLLTARDLMTRNQVSQIVVVDQRNRPVGFLSKRAIARFLLEDSTTRGLGDISVSEATTDSIPTLRLNFPVFNAARLFDTENIAYAVISNDNPLAGIMTETDLCHYYSQKWPHKFKVADFMTRDFIFAKSNYPAVHVAHAIVFRQPSVPVIDEELVGILTLSNILSIRERAPKTSNGRLTGKQEKDVALITTKELMTPNPITTYEDTDLAQAAQIIITKGIGSLPVNDNEPKVVGLLTKHDIVKALGTIGRSMIVEA
ncbi:MAG: CBS domain-containing protein [Candidatus Bathyarchaeia archaeon]